MAKSFGTERESTAPLLRACGKGTLVHQEQTLQTHVYQGVALSSCMEELLKLPETLWAHPLQTIKKRNRYGLQHVFGSLA